MADKQAIYNQIIAKVLGDQFSAGKPKVEFKREDMGARRRGWDQGSSSLQSRTGSNRGVGSSAGSHKSTADPLEAAICPESLGLADTQRPRRLGAPR